ncbi:hypothetical protein SMICM304S_04192 [Streptomyces microflavus]
MVQFVSVGAILALHAVTVRRRERALKLVDPAQTSRRPRGAGQWALLGEVLSRPGHPRRPLVHHLAGARLHRAHVVDRPARRGTLFGRRFDFPGKQVLRAVVTVPFVLPTVVVGTAFLALQSGVGGFLDRAVGRTARAPRCGRSCWRTSSSTTRSVVRTVGRPRGRQL